MKTLLPFALVLAVSSTFAGEWKQLPSLPDTEGFAGSFLGVSNGALLVAGGTNFPGKKPWEGGTKKWYDTVFVLESPTAKWKVAGKLPRPLSYGVSVTYDNGVVCAGGSDDGRHYADVFRLAWSDGKSRTTPLPSLPKPIANCSGAMVGDALYVAGGLEKPDATATLNGVWQMDLRSKMPKWVEVKTWPGSNRMLAVAAGFDGAFWLIGGVDLSAGGDGKPQRRYLTDAYRYDPLTGWKRLADLPYSVVAGPSPAPVDNKSIYLLGGDDGSQVATAPEKHPGFGKTALRYDTPAGRWFEAGTIAAPRAVLPSAFWNNAWVLPGGEARPGVRSPEVWSWTPGTTE
jgi:N-acetylneuraminic acid mutarotase